MVVWRGTSSPMTSLSELLQKTLKVREFWGLTVAVPSLLDEVLRINLSHLIWHRVVLHHNITIFGDEDGIHGQAVQITVEHLIKARGSSVSRLSDLMGGASRCSWQVSSPKENMSFPFLQFWTRDPPRVKLSLTSRDRLCFESAQSCGI